ncbi:MAG: hypothetical protein M3451_04555 [Chloroflexota bacterium]|nr:hypothetical protein [Acidobacteriota bacterium]MDQ3524308.1 hypothetical protein [Chloroflexota bacterium]
MVAGAFFDAALARNVSIAAPHCDKAVFTAGEVEFRGSVWTLLRGLPDLLTFHVFGASSNRPPTSLPL